MPTKAKRKAMPKPIRSVLICGPLTEDVQQLADADRRSFQREVEVLLLEAVAARAK